MKVLIAGDYVPIGRVAKAVEDNRYDAIFAAVKPFTTEANYSIVNLEAPIVHQLSFPIEKTGPNLKCTSKVVDSLNDAGFDCVTLANNHFRDYGDSGINDTLESCLKAGIDYVGGGRDLVEAQQILYKKFDDGIVAIINVCENEWSIATKERGGSAPIDVIQVTRQIHQAKQKADFILLITHGGVEHYSLPTPRMIETFRFFVDMGVDVIINHHQHCYSGFEIYHNKPIFYGIGNFCFDRGEDSEKSWKEGYMVMLDLNRTISFKLIPYLQSDKSEAIEILPENSFQRNIKVLNARITNPEEIRNSYMSFLQERAYYLKMLEPFNNNRLINKLRRLHVIPLLIDRTFKKKLLGVVNCESHREGLLTILKEEF